MKSVLKEIIDRDVTTLGDLDQAKATITSHLNSSHIKTIDKMRMVLSVNRIDTVNSLHQFIFNAYLKYNGLGVTNQR